MLIINTDIWRLVDPERAELWPGLYLEWRIRLVPMSKAIVRDGWYFASYFDLSLISSVNINFEFKELIGFEKLLTALGRTTFAQHPF